jgi:hypothetical protein
MELLEMIAVQMQDPQILQIIKRVVCDRMDVAAVQEQNFHTILSSEVMMRQMCQIISVNVEGCDIDWNTRWHVLQISIGAVNNVLVPCVVVIA